MYKANKIDGTDLRFVVPKHVQPIRDQVLKFVEEKCYPTEAKLHEMRKDDPWDAKGEQKKVMKALQADAKAQGLWALGHPKEIGGQGMPFRDYIYVNEVQGRSEIASGALGTASLQDSLMMYNHGTKALQDKYLAGIVSADITPSFAMTEPDIPSSDPTGIATHAKLEGQGDQAEWVINGRKWFTSNARFAAYTSVMVRTDDGMGHGSFSIIVVPTDTPGYKIIRSTPILGLEGGVDHSEVIYDNVRVPAANILGRVGAGFQIAQERLGPGRIFHCMRWIGQMQRAFDLMLERLSDRRLPDKKRLGDMQLMQNHIFDSYTDIAAHRLLTLAAAEKVDQGEFGRIELAGAKAWGARALCRIMDRALQCWGAKGLTDDTPLSKMYRYAREARYYDGPDETHIQNLGKLILREYNAGRRWDFSEGKAVANPFATAKL